MHPITIPPRVAQIWQEAQALNSQERHLFIKLIFDHWGINPEQDEADWQALSLASFHKDWDNPDDAIYDQWREHYAVPEG
jgi:hypothetical protein